MDLERFARALRLRWLWFKWKQKDRAWNKFDTPCDKTDMELFNASTMVEVGNGKSTIFWTSSWINGKAAKNIAPRLFAKCKRKKIKVDKALNNNKWIEHLLPISDTDELREYVDLWEAIHQIPINSEVEDNIR